MFPGVWDWIELLAMAGVAKTVQAVRDEIRNRDLSDWLGSLPDEFTIPTADIPRASIDQVDDWVVGQPFNPRALREFRESADRLLIAGALASGSAVVSHEVASPRKRNRVKIPDVCKGIGVQCVTFQRMLAQERARFVLDPDLRRSLAAGSTV